MGGMARVLLVDADPDRRELTALRLQVDGHHVLTASGPAEAVFVAAGGPKIDVVAIDAFALGADGLPDPGGLLDILRRHPATTRLPVALYVGYGGGLAVQGLSLAEPALTQGQPFFRLMAAVNSLSQPATVTAE